MDRGETRVENSYNRFKRGEGKRANMFCNYCKKAGHSIEKCYRLHGFPPNNRSKRRRGTAALVQTSDRENDCQDPSSQHLQTPGPSLTP